MFSLLLLFLPALSHTKKSAPPSAAAVVIVVVIVDVVVGKNCCVSHINFFLSSCVVISMEFMMMNLPAIR